MDSIRFSLKEFTELPDEHTTRQLTELADEIFGVSTNSVRIPYRMSIKRPILILIAYIGDMPVGFKIGFEDKENMFYSWLGGVLPSYRGNGIASALMKRQHEWAAQRGYGLVETRTRNRYKPMLILNLKHGFSIVGTLIESKDVKIILRKKLEKKKSE